MEAMRYYPHIEKRLHVVSVLYDLLHVPFTGGFSPYLLYIGPFSQHLYLAYSIDRDGLWEDLFRCLVLGGECEGLGDVVERLDRIRVHGWREVAGELRGVEKGVAVIYRDTVARMQALLADIMGFKRFFTELHVVYGFNPGHGLYGSLLYHDRVFAVVSVFVNAYIEPARALDLIYHEVTHGLMRLNGVELDPEIEEQLIDMLFPEGYLSRLLGLTDTIHIDVDHIDEWLYTVVRDYFDNKLYENGESLLEKIMRKTREHAHIIYS